MKFIASVVTKDGTFNPTVISPLTAPTPQQMVSATRMERAIGSPRLCSQYSTQGANRNTWPADRSISARTSSSTSPTAIAPIGPAYPPAELRLSESVNVDPALIEKYANRPIRIRTGVSSRWYRKRRRTRRPIGAASRRCPGGLSAGAAVGV